MGRSLSFGSTTCDIIALLRLAFAMAPRRRRLAWPQTVTRRLIMQKARRHPLLARRQAIGLRLNVGTWFQVLLTPLIGVLFIVQSPYFSLSVVMEYLALESGLPCFTRSFTASMLLWYTSITEGQDFAYGTFTLYRVTFQTLRLS